MRLHAAESDAMPIRCKLANVNWLLIILLCCAAGIGVAMLYSAANGKWDPWAGRHLARFAITLCFLLAVALTDIRFWLRYAYAFYGLMLLLVAGVEVAGSIGMGAQRWINLGVIQLQPSELMKIALIVALARYFHGLSIDDIARPLNLIIPALMIVAPTILVMRQPDLGTAVMLALSGAAVFFLAGVKFWKFALVGGVALAAMPLLWGMLRGYQKKRIHTFLDPESDPLGAGYHIIQSKIAFGSGGLFGKGYLQGTQGALNFLPEKQTDFIFTMLAEEFGMMGGAILLGLYMLIIVYGVAIALRVQSQFGRLLAGGLTALFFIYVFINSAMVMGILPVVGVPLPLISHGGTAMLAVMIGFGFIICANVHRDRRIGRHADTEP